MHVWRPERSEVTRSSGTGVTMIMSYHTVAENQTQVLCKNNGPNHSNSCSAPYASQITPKAILFHQNSEDHYQSLNLQHKPVTNHEHTTCFSQRPARSCFLDLPHQVPTSSVILTSQHLTICARNGSLTMRKHIVCICLSQVISLSQWSPAQFIYYK